MQAAAPTLTGWGVAVTRRGAGGRAGATPGMINTVPIFIKRGLTRGIGRLEIGQRHAVAQGNPRHVIAGFDHIGARGWRDGGQRRPGGRGGGRAGGRLSEGDGLIRGKGSAEGQGRRRRQGRRRGGASGTRRRLPIPLTATSRRSHFLTFMSGIIPVASAGLSLQAACAKLKRYEHPGKYSLPGSPGSHSKR